MLSDAPYLGKLSAEASARWTFATAFLAMFSLAFCRACVSLDHQQASVRFGDYFSFNGGAPGTIFINVLAIWAGIYLVERLGYRVLLLVGAGLQLAAITLEMSLPVVFAVGGHLCTWLSMGLVDYLLATSSGLNEALAFLLISTLWNWDPFHAWGRLFAAAPLAVWLLNFLNTATGQNASLMVGLGLLSSLAFAGSVLYLHLTKTEIEVDDAPILEELSSLLKPTFLFLAVLAVLTWTTCSLDIFRYSQLSFGESNSMEFIVRSSQSLGLVSIVGFVALGYLRRWVKDFDLALVGAGCCMIGAIRLVVVASETDFYRAWLFMTIGCAFVLPLLMAWATTWMADGTRLYIGALLGLNATSVAAIGIGLPWLGFSASHEATQMQGWICATTAAVLTVIYGWLIYQKQEGFFYQFLTHIHWPANKTLSNFLGWSMFGLVTSIASPPAAEDLQQWFGQLILKFVYGYVFGPFWSTFWVFSLAANLLALYISSVILMRRTAEVPMAKQAFTALFFMAMFAIWLEGWLTAEGVAWNLLTAYFQVSLFFFMDIAATIGWLWALHKVHSRLDEL